ncbi:MAG: biotin transporter BioY [Lachnospiraceae bacterium]|nr:biotin transporter BioY [Lachnospiraceae bacterium]
MRTLDLVYIAIGAALITVGAWITIPTTVPFTLQTFAVFAVLLLLGGLRGTMSVLVYIMLGAVGVPVFSGFNSGFGVLLGSTGGYIIGFIFMGLLYMLFTKLLGEKQSVKIAALLVGLTVCYAFGTAWFMYVYIGSKGPVGVMTVLGWCVFPFIVPDLVKMAVAVLVARRVKPFIKDNLQQ